MNKAIRILVFNNVVLTKLKLFKNTNRYSCNGRYS
jgi:hypothetical protein